MGWLAVLRLVVDGFCGVMVFGGRGCWFGCVMVFWGRWLFVGGVGFLWLRSGGGGCCCGGGVCDVASWG